MIYIKKKSRIKRIKNRIFSALSEFDGFNAGFFGVFLRNILFSLVFLFLLFYVLYLFLMPELINEKNVESVINNYLSKNTKLILDVDNITIKPNYKFDVCISLDKLNLKYNKSNNFISANNLRAEINFITLFFGYIDLNNIKVKNITLNTNFTKNKRYNSFDYIPLNLLEKDNNSKLKIRNIKIAADNFILNLYDENIKKQFRTVFNNLKVEKKYNLLNSQNPFLISAKGKSYAQNKKLSDFDIKISYKSKNKNFKKIKSFIEKINYNPFLYADKFDFYSNCIVDLKIDKDIKKNNLNGYVKLSDLSFNTNGIKIPKNNLLINFKNDKIFSNFNFNFTDNQFIKVKSYVDISKNKFIELNLDSSEINLEELHGIIKNLTKIANLKFNYDDIELKGFLNASLYIKSDFKKINSKGNLKIKNAILKHKRLNLSLNSITSIINLENNKINIINTSACFDKSKFNLKGQIDENLNLNININSDVINFAQFFKFISNLPLITKTGLNLNDYVIKSGFLKINSKIKGNINNPIIESKSSLKNLSLYIKSLNTSILIDEIKLIPQITLNQFKNALLEASNLKIKYKNYDILSKNIKLKIFEKDIEILKSNVFINKINADIEGIIKNYSSKMPETNLKISSILNNKNNLIVIKNINNPKALIDITIKNNNLNINQFVILNSYNKIADITGKINNLNDKNPYFDKIKILLNEKISVYLPSFDNISFIISGNTELYGKLSTLKANANLNITSFNYPKTRLYIKDLILNIKDSNCYINIINAKFFDSYFDLTSQLNYKNNKITASYLNFNSQYIDFEKLSDLLNKNNNNKTQIEINNLKGNILTFKMPDFDLNNLKFEGNFKNQILNLNKINAQIYDSNIEGAINSNLQNQKTRLNLILKSLNTRLMHGLLKEYQIAASGRLSALIDAQFYGFDVNSILKSIQGYVKFNINDGELAQFAKLERFLQAGNILSQSILKLTLNSTISTLTKQNTGYFKTIEGTIKLNDSWANIQYLKSQGINMSLYMEGRFNLLTLYTQLTILGRIPSSIVSVLGDIGSFSTEKLVDKMSDDTKEFVKSLTVSPIEKMLTMKVLSSDIDKIPPLVYRENTKTREFLVKINGKATSTSSIQMFKWVVGE